MYILDPDFPGLYGTADWDSDNSWGYTRYPADLVEEVFDKVSDNLHLKIKCLSFWFHITHICRSSRIDTPDMHCNSF